MLWNICTIISNAAYQFVCYIGLLVTDLNSEMKVMEVVKYKFSEA